MKVLQKQDQMLKKVLLQRRQNSKNPKKALTGFSIFQPPVLYFLLQPQSSFIFYSDLWPNYFALLKYSLYAPKVLPCF